MSDDTPTERYPVGGEPVPPSGTNPPGAVPPTVPLPGEAASPTGATEPLAPGADAPTERFVPPAPPPATPAMGAGDEPPEKKSKALLITLISIGAALLIALIILLILLFNRNQPEPEPTSASPSVTPSETPSETPSASPSATEAPVVPGPAIASYSAAPTTVECPAGTTTATFHVAWQATGTTLWFGVGTDDASAEPFGTFPLNHEMDFNYQCGQTDEQQRYTITVQGENGEKTSQTIVVQEKNS